GLFAGRALVGIGLGLGTGAGIALMVEASPARRVWLGSTFATFSFVLGSGLGLLLAGVVAVFSAVHLILPFMIVVAEMAMVMVLILAGVLAEFSAVPLILPFIIMVAAMAIVMVLIALMPLHRPFTRQRWRPTWPSVPGPMRTSFNIAALTGFVGWTALGLFLALLPSMAQSVLPKSGTLSAGVIVGSVLVVSAASQL